MASFVEIDRKDKIEIIAREDAKMLRTKLRKEIEKKLRNKKENNESKLF